MNDAFLDERIIVGIAGIGTAVFLYIWQKQKAESGKMKNLLILISCLTLLSCKQKYEGGYQYNENLTKVNDSLQIENEMDSFRLENTMKIGSTISDTLIID